MKLGYKKLGHNELTVLTNRFFFNFLSPKSMFSRLSNPIITISGYNKPIWMITEFDCIFYLAAHYIETVQQLYSLKIL